MNFSKIYIKKRTLPEWLALYIFLMPFFLSFFQDFLHFPSIIKYTIDVAWVGGFFLILMRRQQSIHRRLLPFAVFTVAFLLYVLVVYIFSYQSAFYFLWGIRNNFRYYVAFIIFAMFLKQEDLKLCMTLIDVLFWTHVVVSLIQFFFFGYKWDYLGGIFGVQLGCNGHSFVLLIIVCTKSLLLYMNGKEKIVICMLKCAAALVIASMAELKFFFVIFLGIVIIATIITSFSRKKVFLIIGIALLMYMSGNLFVAIWGEDAKLSFERLIQLVTASNYASSEDLGRFTALPILSKTILKDIPSKLFGLGIGNCDTSSFAICNTPFYQANAHLNYNWLSSAFLFLETGYLGMTLYIVFFLITCLMALKMKRQNAENAIYTQMAIITSFTAVALMFYNSSLRTEAGYMVYFILALPFVGTIGKQENQMCEESQCRKT